MKLDLQVIYEDKDYVAINKPAGLVVHSDGKTEELSVADWVLFKYPETKDVGEPIELTKGGKIERPGIVHRIDRDTSGVLVLAKNKDAHAHLKAQFQNREVQKTYHAFVYGEMKEIEGTIDRPIGRSKKDFRLWSAQRGARGEMREAITNYNVLEVGNGSTYVEVYPKTGRTHQIRVHFKAINYPVVADSLYAPGHKPILGFKRLALHAYKAGFHTLEGKWIEVVAPLPEDFKKAKEMLKKS